MIIQKYIFVLNILMWIMLIYFDENNVNKVILQNLVDNILEYRIKLDVVLRPVTDRLTIGMAFLSLHIHQLVLRRAVCIPTLCCIS